MLMVMTVMTAMNMMTMSIRSITNIRHVCISVYMSICMYIHTYCIYIYIYRYGYGERERESEGGRERERDRERERGGERERDRERLGSTASVRPSSIVVIGVLRGQSQRDPAWRLRPLFEEPSAHRGLEANRIKLDLPPRFGTPAPTLESPWAWA